MIRCMICGRFVLYEDVDNGKVKIDVYYDSNENEVIDSYHLKCEELNNDK